MTPTSAVKNPLTVIAIFAGIAEISGTTVLPFIQPENQRLYIWFLMIFPTALVFIFFLTLNFNRAALYAPSDYQNEDNYFRNIRAATFAEREEKALKEIEDEEASQPENTDNLPTSSIREKTTTNTSNTEAELTEKRPISNQNVTIDAFLPSKARFERYFKLESLAMEKLQYETKKLFQRNISFETKNNGTLIFDGIWSNGNLFSIAEINLSRSLYMSKQKFRRFLSIVKNIQLELKSEGKSVEVHYIIVYDDEKPTEWLRRKREFLSIAEESAIDATIYLYTSKDIEKRIV